MSSQIAGPFDQQFIVFENNNLENPFAATKNIRRDGGHYVASLIKDLNKGVGSGHHSSLLIKAVKNEDPTLCLSHEKGYRL